MLGGSHTYVEAITAPWLDRVRTAAPVRRIERLADEVRIEADGCETESFDRVVIATHSDRRWRCSATRATPSARSSARSPTSRTRPSSTPTRALMPRRRAAWSSWNFHLAEQPPACTTVTYWMNHLQRLRAKRKYFLTLNRDEEIDPDKVLRRFTYDHPVYTAAGVAAQARRAEVSGVERTHYCGAYWGWGFHEDGVVSGLRVCEELGAACRDPTPATGDTAIAGPADRDARPDEDAEEAVAA